MIDVIYIGNFARVVEYIVFNKQLQLSAVFIEQGKENDEIITVCLHRGIDFYLIKNCDEISQHLEKYKAQYFIMCSFGKLIKKSLLNRIKGFNIHYSLLPNYKGRHPTFYGTIANEKYLGISIHEVTEKFDEGKIICQAKEPYYLWENENDIFRKLTERIPSLLEKLTKYVVSPGDYATEPNGIESYFKPVSEMDYTINISSDSYSTIFNKIRAQAKYKGAVYKSNNEKKYFIKEAQFSLIKKEYKAVDDFIYTDKGELGIVINDRIFLKLIKYVVEA